MPVGAVEDYDEPEKPLATVPTMPVHVVSSDAPPGRQIAAEHGYWRTYLISPSLGANSATPGAVRIANRSLRRRRLLIAVNGVVSNSNATSTTELTPNNPAAGAGFQFVVPAGQSITLQSVFWKLTTSAVVANRFMQVLVKDGSGNTIFETGNNSAVVASTNCSLSSYIGAAQINNATGVATSPLPNITLSPGWTVNLTVLNEDVGDQISNIIIDYTTPSQSTTDGVVVGNSGVINSGQPMTPLNGIGAGYIQTGQSLRWECQQELWAAYPASNVGNVVVSVCDEAYASDPKDFEHAEDRGENT